MEQVPFSDRAQPPGPSYVLTIGDTSCDVLIRVPVPGAEHPDDPELIAGGTAGNTALALARLGMPSRLVTELGDDYYGRYVLKVLEAAGVDTTDTHIFPGYPTTQVIILLDEQRSPVADWPIADPSLFTLITVEDITEKIISKAAWVHTSGTSAMYASAREVMLHTVNLAGKSGTPLSFDLNLRLHREVGTQAGLQSLRYAAAQADVVLGSESEWRYLGKSDDPGAAARKLLSRPDQTAVIRNGPAGAVGIRGERTIHSPAFRVQVRDALGAGDTFDAGFILARLEGQPLETCLRWGNAAAALKLSRSGSHRGGATREELAAFLSSSPAIIG